MKKKVVSLFLVLGLTVGLVAGCGNSVDTDKKTGDDTAKESSTEEIGAEGGDAAEGTEENANMPVDEDGNPSPFGKYEEAVTINIIQNIDPTESLPDGDTATDNFYLRKIKELMNIDVSVKWSAATADYGQKLNLAIASNDLPDIFVVSEQQLRMLAKSDMIEDLTPYYETYISDTLRSTMDATGGKAMDSVTFDGKMLALPAIDVEANGTSLMWIRQDWLDALELEVPTTMEELETVAKAFVDNNMGGEHTVGILAGSNQYNQFLGYNNTSTLDGIFGAYNSFPGYWIEGEDGNIVYGSITEETKEALGELNRLFEAGLIDPEIGARGDVNAAWRSGEAGILFSPWWFGYSGVNDAVSLNPEMEWRAYAPPLTEDGIWNAKYGGVGTRYAVVRKGYEHPEVIFLLNNFLMEYSDEWVKESALNQEYYPGRVVMAQYDELKVDYKVLQAKINGEEMPDYDLSKYMYPESDLVAIEEALQAPWDDLSIEKWNVDSSSFGRMYSILIGVAPLVEAEEEGFINIISSATYSMTETMEQKWANLVKKENETFLSIIIGAAPLDAFDTFVEEWKAEGGDEITAEVQDIKDVK